MPFLQYKFKHIICYFIIYILIHSQWVPAFPSKRTILSPTTSFSKDTLSKKKAKIVRGALA